MLYLVKICIYAIGVSLAAPKIAALGIKNK